MNCNEARENLELFVLGELPPAQEAELEEHLQECLDCRAAEKEYRGLVGEIRREAGRTAVRPELERNLRETLRAGAMGERRKSRIRRKTLAVAPLAALLLAAWILRWPPGGGGLGPERWHYRGAWAAPASRADGIVVEGSRMYFLRERSPGSRVTAVHASTGELLWESEFPSLGFLAADGKRVFCLASPHPGELHLVALEGESGNELWRHREERSRRLQSLCHPTLLSSHRVCWTNRDTIHLLDAKTGAPIWSRSIPGEGSLSRPAVRSESLLVASRKRLYCLEIDTGAPTWSKDLDGNPSPSRPLLAVGGEKLYCLQRRIPGAELYCMDLGTLTLSWKRRVPAARSLLATGKGIYLRGQRILALDERTGKPLWDHAADGCGPLSFMDGLIHFVDSTRNGRLVAVEERTGEEAWEIAGIQSCDAFRRIGDTGYIKTRDGIVHALLLGKGQG